MTADVGDHSRREGRCTDRVVELEGVAEDTAGALRAPAQGGLARGSFQASGSDA